MKAVLYGAVVHNRIVWLVSPDIRVDCAYWLRHGGSDAALVVLKPHVSLGQAFLLRQLLVQAPARFVRRGTERIAEWLSRYGGAGDTDAAWRHGLRWTEMRANAMRELAAAVRIDSTLLGELERLLEGRCLTRDELGGLLEHAGLTEAADHWATYVQAAALRRRVILRNGFETAFVRRFPTFQLRAVHVCRRCGAGPERMNRTPCPSCGGECAYCEQCLTMGRIRFCSPIVYGAESPKTEPAVRVSGWNNRDGSPSDRVGVAATGSAGHRSPADKWGLSPAQAEAVERGLQFMRNRAGAAATDADGKRRFAAFPRFRGEASVDDLFDDAEKSDPPSFLIWAVTGAGKTEMIFPLIDDALARGGRVLVATPRRDVVLELEPRLKRAFPGRTVVALYGGSPQRWERGDITLATTHQLLRFRRHFDLTVIDELDAFPYHNNPMLQFAARRVCKSDGVYVLLSATPPPALQQAARRNRLPHAKVPVRFHRHPLPVPTRLRMKPLASDRPELPGRIIQAMASSVERGAQIFVFVPRIGDVEPVVRLLRASFGRLRIEGTSSQDPARADKVREFRDGTIRMLVTTTILERGVTVPKTDVFVLSADSPLFDEAALVQMAGRAGRSKDDPRGNVYFCSAEKTRAQTGAIRHIRAMNRLAKRKGYLIET